MSKLDAVYGEPYRRPVHHAIAAPVRVIRAGRLCRRALASRRLARAAPRLRKGGR
ncbi:hypothetical protein [Burkholderia plantarii]|uniref:hypothetical protein n=1 Tax=Burkholderia plantarii TaxID=41899 RepID=UPI0018DC023C|nr:hypothetical protein [Burkholderia plantarii]MBI0328618.1 hypothetical protein [Burkholderia plantarii]